MRTVAAALLAWVASVGLICVVFALIDGWNENYARGTYLLAWACFIELMFMASRLTGPNLISKVLGEQP